MTDNKDLDDQAGLVCAYILPPQGDWKEVGWEQVRAWSPDQGLLWVHLDRTEESVQHYVRQGAALDPIVQDALLAEATRPRALGIGDGLLLILRGVNLNPGADPEDMVSLRIFAEPNRLISMRNRPLMAVMDLRQRLTTELAPRTVGALVVQLAAGLVDRMASVIDALDEEEDRREQDLVDGAEGEIRMALATVRRQAIVLRRYLAPQREALSRIQSEELSWMDPRLKARLREVTDRVIRYVEDLDAIRERAAVIQDELANRIAERMNRNMYLLTIVATVMLPLGFLTGLLGVNVDGIPGSEDSPWAFLAVCLGMGAIVGAEIWLLRRAKWF